MAITPHHRLKQENNTVYDVTVSQTLQETEKLKIETMKTTSQQPFLDPMSPQVNYFKPDTTDILPLHNRNTSGSALPEKVKSFDLTTTLVCVGIAVVLLAIVALLVVVCHRRLRKRRNKRKDLLAAKYDKIFTTLRRTSPVDVISTRRQLSNANATDVRSTYNTFDLVTEHPQEDSQLNKTSHNTEKLTKYHSMDSGSVAHHSPKRKQMKKSKSLASLPKVAPEPEFSPTVSFSLKFDTKSRQLRMKLLSVSELPVKCYGYDVSAVVYLFPRNTDGVHSRCVTGKKDVQLNETFLFDDMTLAEVEKSTLRLMLQYKRKLRSGKEDFLGEMYMKCCDFDWSTNETLTFNAIPLKSKVKKGTPEKYLLEELGSLFVCLEYQTVASRMKVMVRKASNLPKSDKLIGEPGHYVVIHLRKDSEVTRVQETKSLTGHSPIWNQPFLFDLGAEAETKYSLDFVIMRKKLHTKDAVIGHVTIGANGCRSGRQHWKEIMSPRPAESAKWHSITPVLNEVHSRNISTEE